MEHNRRRENRESLSQFEIFAKKFISSGTDFWSWFFQTFSFLFTFIQIRAITQETWNAHSECTGRTECFVFICIHWNVCGGNFQYELFRDLPLLEANITKRCLAQTLLFQLNILIASLWGRPQVKSDFSPPTPKRTAHPSIFDGSRSFQSSRRTADVQQTCSQRAAAFLSEANKHFKIAKKTASVQLLCQLCWG